MIAPYRTPDVVASIMAWQISMKAGLLTEFAHLETVSHISR